MILNIENEIFDRVEHNTIDKVAIHMSQVVLIDAFNVLCSKTKSYEY